MSCDTCSAIEAKVDPDAPHVLRKCAVCNGEHRALDRPKNGIGIDVKAGDRFVMPSEFLRVAANPLKGNGQLSKEGIGWFAELVFDIELAKTERTPEKMLEAMKENSRKNERLFQGSKELIGIDLTTEAGCEEAAKRIAAIPKTVEWYGFYAALLADIAGDAIVAGNAAEAAWAMTCSPKLPSL